MIVSEAIEGRKYRSPRKNRESPPLVRRVGWGEKLCSFFALCGAHSLSRLTPGIETRVVWSGFIWTSHCWYNVVAFRRTLSRTRDLCFPLTSATGRYSACQSPPPVCHLLNDGVKSSNGQFLYADVDAVTIQNFRPETLDENFRLDRMDSCR